MAKTSQYYAHLPEPLKSNLPIMFESYDKLCASNPSSWIVWNKDRFKAYNSQVCHAGLRWEKPGLDELVTAVPNRCELALEYLRMLIRGPFRSLSDLIKLDHVKYNYYLHCLDLKKWPANVLMNFCIASRIPIEFDFLLKPWAKFCEQGYDQTLAFLLTCSYGSTTVKTQHKTRNFDIHHPGHMWFDPASNWFNILNGIIEQPSMSYHQSPGNVTPSNIIWGKCDDYKKLMKMSDAEIAEFYTQSIKVCEPPEPPLKFLKTKGMPFVHLNPLGEIPLPQINEAMALHFDLAQQPLANPQPFVQHEIGVAVHDDDDEDEFNEPEFDD